MLTAVLGQMQTDIRKALKEPLMRMAEAEVDAAVDAAVSKLSVELASVLRPQDLARELIFTVRRK